MLLVGIAAALVLAFNAADIGALRSEKTTAGSDPWSALQQGDLSVKYALAAGRLGIDARRSARQAIESYKQALPWPAAYRRIGFTRRIFLGKSPLPDLTRMDSPKVVKGLSRKQVKLLQDEVRRWRRVYAGKRLPAPEADAFAARVKRLNLGPLRWAAAAEVYARSGQVGRANEALERARGEAYRSAGLGIAVIVGMVAAGLAGIGLAVSFFVKYGAELRSATPPEIDSSVLVMGFVTYIVGSLVIGMIAGLALDASGITGSGRAAFLVEALAQIAATVAAFGVSLAVTFRLAAGVHLGLDHIGLGPIRIWRAVRWGVGGYCAALPFMGVTLLVSYWLQHTLLRGVPTPEHPIVPYVAKGGAVFWAAFALATVVVPVVEEIVFRGMLYTALRAQMRVWPAALVSGGIFAVVHPALPGQFLPILALGVVLAILREKTGSLAPSVVCHSINNAVMLALVRVIYGS